MRVVEGHLNYYGVPFNIKALTTVCGGGENSVTEIPRIMSLYLMLRQIPEVRVGCVSSARRGELAMAIPTANVLVGLLCTILYKHKFCYAVTLQ